MLVLFLFVWVCIPQKNIILLGIPIIIGSESSQKHAQLPCVVLRTRYSRYFFLKIWKLPITNLIPRNKYIFFLINFIFKATCWYMYILICICFTTDLKYGKCWLPTRLKLIKGKGQNNNVDHRPYPLEIQDDSIYFYHRKYWRSGNWEALEKCYSPNSLRFLLGRSWKISFWRGIFPLHFFDYFPSKN